MSLLGIMEDMEDDEKSFNIARVDMNEDKFFGNKPSLTEQQKPAPAQVAVNENNVTPQTTTPQQSEDEFDPNKMFNIGVRNVTYENPFSKEEMEELAKDLSERTSPDNAQTLSIPESDKSYTESITESQANIVANDDGLGFEIVGSEQLVSEPSLESQAIETEAFSIDIGGDELGDSLGTSLESQSSLTEEELFTELGKHSVEVNSAELAEGFNPNTVVSETVEDSGIISVEEDEQIIAVEEDELDTGGIIVTDETLEEVSEYDYVKQMEKNLGIENKPSEEDYYNQAPPEYNPNEPTYSAPPTEHQPQPRVEQPQPQAVMQNGLNVFHTNLGEKLRLPKQDDAPVFETTNQYILDFVNADNTDVMGEVMITNAKIVPYGNKGDTRVEWDMLTRNLKLVTASQFTLKNDITLPEIEPFFGKTVKVTGKVSLYRGKKQLTVSLIDNAQHTTPADFQGPASGPSADSEIEMYKDWYRFLTSTIKTPWIKEVNNHLLVRSGNLNKLLLAGAGSSVHDAEPGGLFKHKMKVTMNAYNVAKTYPNVNSDIVVAASLWHDLGKLKEISNKKYTTEGDLNGHIVLGYTMVQDAIREMQQNGLEVNDNECSNLLHCILSHHGQLEWGSPVTPKTSEAMLLHLVDMIDARLTHMSETLGDSKKAYSKTFKSSVYDLN